MSPALPRPINSFGKVKARWVSWQLKQRKLVYQRDRGLCEGCKGMASEVHHVFGRRSQVGEPLASHHTFCAALCVECHRWVTREPASLAAVNLRIAAMQRAREHFGLSDEVVSPWAVEDVLKASGQFAELEQEASR